MDSKMGQAYEIYRNQYKELMNSLVMLNDQYKENG